MKVGTWHAAYAQYVNGDVDGKEVGYHLKTDKETLDREAKLYASNILSSALTAGSMLDRAAVQKLDIGKLIAYYYNDARNNLNNSLTDARNIKNNFKKAGELIKEGDYQGAFGKIETSGDTVIRSLVLSMIGLTFQKYVSGMFRGNDDEDDVLDLTPHDGEEPAAYMGRLGYTLAYEQMFQNSLVMRDLTWAGNTGQAPSGLLGRATADLAYAGKGGFGFAYDLLQGLTFEDAYNNLDKKEKKSLWRTMGTLGKGMPVNAPLKYLDHFEKEGEAPMVVNILGGILGATIETAQEYIQKHEQENMTEEERFQKMLKDEEPSLPDTSANSLYQGAKEFLAQATETEKMDLTLDEYNTIKEWESGGQMVANKTGSSAYGYWQFVPKTWIDPLHPYPL